MNDTPTPPENISAEKNPRWAWKEGYKAGQAQAEKRVREEWERKLSSILSNVSDETQQNVEGVLKEIKENHEEKNHP